VCLSITGAIALVNLVACRLLQSRGKSITD